MACLDQTTQHLKVTRPRGTQQSAPTVRSDSRVVSAATSDLLMGAALCLDLWHCLATMTSGDFTGLAVLHYPGQGLTLNKSFKLEK